MKMRKKKLMKSLSTSSAASSLCISQEDHDAVGTSSTAATPPRARTRKQIQELMEVSTPPSATKRLALTPPAKSERFLRGRLPRCSDFGTMRHYAFKGRGFLFCSPCDNWDARGADCKKNASSSSRAFACTAGHQTFSHPTSLCKEFWSPRMRNKDEADKNSDLSSAAETDDDASDEDEEEGTVVVISAPAINNQPAADASSGSSTTSTNQRTQGEMDILVVQLQGKVALLQQRIYDMERTNQQRMQQDAATLDASRANVATDHATDAVGRDATFREEVIQAINLVLRKYSRWSLKRKHALAAKAVWDHNEFVPGLMKLSRQYFRANVFTPYNIVREMDLAGGTLSYEGIDVMRRVETGGLKRFRGTMIPSKSELKRMAGLVEWFARPLCPYMLKVTPMGEAVEFNYVLTFLCILKVFHLDNIGKQRSLSVASSIDGARVPFKTSISRCRWYQNNGPRCPVSSDREASAC